MKKGKWILAICGGIAVALFFNGIILLGDINLRTNSKLNHEENLQKPVSPAPNAAWLGNLLKPNVDLNEKPVNFLVLGLDQEKIRSDVILLIHYNPVEGVVNMLSIARDTKVRYKSKTVKINAVVGMGGDRAAISKVEEITGLPVHYHAVFSFDGFRKLIDLLDGVEVDVPFDMDYDDSSQGLHIHLKKGRQVLDGDKAEQFVRYRKGNETNEGYKDGDLGRIKAQQILLKNLVDQKVKLKYLSKVDEILMVLQEHVRTNIQPGDIYYYAKYMMNLRSSAVNAFILPGEGKYENGAWYYVYDRREAEKMMRENFQQGAY